MKRKLNSVFIILLAAVMLFCACKQEQDVSIAESDASSLEFDQFSNAENPPVMPWDEGIVEFAVNRNDFFYTVAKEYGQELHLKRGKDDVVLLAAVQFDAIIPSPDGSKVLFNADDEIYIYYYDTQKLWQEEIYGLPEGFLPKRIVWLDSENYIFTAYSENELGGGKIYRAGTGGGKQAAEICVDTQSRRLHIENITSDGESLFVKTYYFEPDFTSHEVLYYIIPLEDTARGVDVLFAANGISDSVYNSLPTVSTEAITAKPDEIKSASGGRECSYGELIEMTPDEIGKEIFEPAIEHYGNFTGLGFIHSSGSIEMNIVFEDGQEENWIFSVCDDERYPTLDAFIAETRKYFAKELAAKLICDEDYPKFGEYEGSFIFTDSARGSNLNYISTEYSIESHSEREIVYLATFRYIKDEFYDIIDNGEATDEQCYFEEYRYRFILEDGRWVFENFSLPY